MRTRQGSFSGFVQWDRQECVGPDELVGRTADAELRLRFNTIRSIARRSNDSSLVTLLDGREVVLSGTRDVGGDNRGIYVDDRRYGRVLVSWDAFERIDFSAAGSGPGYNDFAPGRPLAGTVITRAGRRLTGRLVYDLDESEITETLDAPSGGVDYTIPFGLIASVAPVGREERGVRRASVTLHDGAELQLERAGDLGERNAGPVCSIVAPCQASAALRDLVPLQRRRATSPALASHQGNGLTWNYSFALVVNTHHENRRSNRCSPVDDGSGPCADHQPDRQMDWNADADGT